MGIATKDSVIAAIRPLFPVAVEAPDLGGTVHVARLTAGQLDQYHEAIGKADNSLARGTVLALALTDEAGARLFTPADAAQLAELPADAVQPVIDRFFEVNRIGARKN